ncbi:MAG: acyl-CoA thioesterase [Myxococcales bacterium]|nr:acyl-CoA thioesterase [Myxococcales bacterium]
MTADLSRFELDVRFAETDLMGIVHHATYLVYFEAARVDWLKKRGAFYQDWAALGAHLPVAEVKLRYKKPARFDERLVVETRLVEAKRFSLRFAQEALRSGELLCAAEVLLACVGDDLALRRIPDELAAVLGRGELARE